MENINVGDIVRIVTHEELVERGYKPQLDGYTAGSGTVWWNKSMDKWIGTTATVIGICGNDIELSQPREKLDLDSITDSGWTVIPKFVEVVESHPIPSIEDLLSRQDGEYVINGFNIWYRVNEFLYALTNDGKWTIKWSDYCGTMKPATFDLISRFPQLRFGDDFILIDKDAHILDRFVLNRVTIQTILNDKVADCIILRHNQKFRVFDDDDYVMCDGEDIIRVGDLPDLRRENVGMNYRYLDKRFVEKTTYIIKGSLDGDFTIDETPNPVNMSDEAAQMMDDDTTVYVKNDRVYTSDGKFILTKESYKYVG